MALESDNEDWEILWNRSKTHIKPTLSFRSLF
jgi:hypothetical protein